MSATPSEPIVHLDVLAGVGRALSGREHDASFGPQDAGECVSSMRWCV